MLLLQTRAGTNVETLENLLELKLVPVELGELTGSIALGGCFLGMTK